MASYRRNKRQAGMGCLFLASLPLLLLLGLPIVILTIKGLTTDGAVLADPSVTQAISLSLVTSLTTVAITAITGLPVAWLIARFRFPGRLALETLLDLVIVLPPAVAGVALLLTLGRGGVIGQWLAQAQISIPFTPTAVIIAQLFVAAPYAIRTAIAALTTIQQDIEDAAAMDGASGLQTAWAVTLPLILPQILAGLTMTWARALGEFGATIIFAGNFSGKTQTIPLVIYLGFEIDLNRALILSALLLAIAFGLLGVMKWLVRGALQPDWNLADQ